MKYQKLSEVIAELDNPQRSDTFVKHLKVAVREGQVEAAYLPERFTLPKEFQRRGAEGSYQRDAREMLIEVTPDFETWLEETRAALASRPRRGRVPVSVQSIEAGEVDFKALAEETRRKMQASYGIRVVMERRVGVCPHGVAEQHENQRPALFPAGIGVISG
jgi:hypothetical protein